MDEEFDVNMLIAKCEDDSLPCRVELKRDSDLIKPFIDKFNNMKKINELDYDTFDLALKNGDIATIEEIVNKYNMYDDYINFRALFEELREELINVGVDVGYIENYSPRTVNPDLTDEYLSFLKERDVKLFNSIDEELNRLEKEGKIFSKEDKVKYTNQMLNGSFQNSIMSAGSSSTKERKIKKLTPEQNQYYLSSIESITKNVEQIRKSILQRKGDLKMNNYFAEIPKIKYEGKMGESPEAD